MLNHRGTKLIETERLILRRFNLKDTEDMYNNWANDDEVTKHLSWPIHESIDVSAKIIESWVRSYDNNETYNWAIELKEIGEVIGSIGIVGLDNIYEQCSIGYCIGKSFWGKGITTEAFIGLIEFLFKEVGFERIQAYHHIDNPASGRVMIKAGLKYEGRLRNYRKKLNGIYVDCDFYGIIKSDLED